MILNSNPPRRHRLALTLPLFLTATLLCGADAFASFSLGFNQEFSNGTAPASNLTPWVNADFHDNLDGTVQLTLSNPHLTASENVSQFYFNFRDSLNLANLTLTLAGTSGAFTVPTAGDITKSQNQLKADGDGLYDVTIDFAVGGTLSQTFGAGDQIVYTLGYSSPISAADFLFQSQPAGGHGPFYAAAHVQNTGAQGNGSGWLSPVLGEPAPEPSTIAIAAAALLIPLANRHLRQPSLVENELRLGKPVPQQQRGRH